MSNTHTHALSLCLSLTHIHTQTHSSVTSPYFFVVWSMWNDLTEPTLKNLEGEVGLYGWVMSKLIMEVDSDWGSQSDSVRKLHSVETLIWSKLLVERGRKRGEGGERAREGGEEGVLTERMLCHWPFVFEWKQNICTVLNIRCCVGLVHKVTYRSWNTHDVTRETHK